MVALFDDPTVLFDDPSVLFDGTSTVAPAVETQFKTATIFTSTSAGIGSQIVGTFLSVDADIPIDALVPIDGGALPQGATLKTRTSATVREG